MSLHKSVVKLTAVEIHHQELSRFNRSGIRARQSVQEVRSIEQAACFVGEAQPAAVHQMLRRRITRTSTKPVCA
jgi:hypothetical protein